MQDKTVSLKIDGITVTVPEGTTILNAAKSAGIDIPHFCYHPKLSIAGNCRICAVEVQGMKNPAISCRETVKDGMTVYTQSRMAIDARRSTLEFILINHPLDCPICDCSGECDLQDYYFDYSLQPSRFNEEKIHKPKVIDAGINIVLDAERCVSCTLCIRFCEEIVGKHEIGLMERGGYQEITARGTLNNKYSLCTVDICPVGALLSKDFRFKKRVWLLKSVPAVCTGCATGCNTWIDYKDDVVYRIRPRDNDKVNGPWMCDDGRMTYKKLGSEDRALKPIISENGELKEADWDHALNKISSTLKGISADKTAGVLSAQATLEENEAFNQLFRGRLKTNNIFMYGKIEDPDFADNFLRDRDQNPNTAGVRQFTELRFDPKSKHETYFILGDLAAEDFKQIVNNKPKHIIIASSSTLNLFRFGNDTDIIMLPLAPVEEQDGTLINRQGITQKTCAAYPPCGESKTGWEIANLIAKSL